MAHVFIVNETTFKYHLENLFAGTGASNVPTDFIFNSSIKLNTQDEKRSIGMVTDVSRIRIGDKIIFFVTGVSKFYGIFQAASEFFLDPNDNNNYLKNQMGKILTYRILLKPYRVYSSGVSEYDVLDSLKNINYPDEICWSLIYRKLGGNRGCTMITDQEYTKIEQKIMFNNTLLNCKNFTFNASSNTITSFNGSHKYKGRQLNIINNLKNNMNFRYSNKKAFEHYIQYFSIITLKNNPLKLLSSNLPITWIGNEVMCSFGQHRIDTLVIQENKKTVELSLIEMKDEKVSCDIIKQLESYIIWLIDYILPHYLRNNKKIIINPLIISDGIPHSRQNTKNKLSILENQIIKHSWTSYNQKNIAIKQTRIIHFNNNNGKLIF